MQFVIGHMKRCLMEGQGILSIEPPDRQPRGTRHPLLPVEREQYASLPPTSTITFYEGRPPVGFLRDRTSAIIDANPWLAGRLQTTGGEVKVFVPETPVPRDSSSFAEAHVVGLHSELALDEMYSLLRPYALATGEASVDRADRPLFRVT